jgi:very-short-patch-repair endonuclease/ribosomal protein L37AE/L43A
MEQKELFKCEKCGLIFSKNGYKSHINKCKLNEFDVKNIIKDYVFDSYSIRDIQKKYLICKTLIDKILGVNKRTLSQSLTLAHKTKPENFKLNEISKNKIRKARLSYMKENPDKTAWRQKNMSYPEKIFKEKLEEIGLDKKYLIIREYCVFPYFIDFAFMNEKIAIEIDGSQHLETKRIANDIKKDKLLNENGWVVYRVTANQVKYSINNVVDELLIILNKTNNEIKTIKSGIVEYKSKYKIEAERIKDEKIKNGGLSDKQIESFKKRNSDYIVKKILLKNINLIEILNNILLLGYKETAKRYGYKSKDLTKYINEIRIKTDNNEDIEILLKKVFKYRIKKQYTCKQCGELFYNDKGKKVFCCKECLNNYINRNIPLKEDLISDFIKLKTTISVSLFYKVSEGCIRKWCKKYNINYKIYK